MGAPFGKADAEIGGRVHHLVFNFGAMAAIENHPYGGPFQSFARELAPNEDGSPKEDVKLSTAALLLWGCLRAKHPNVSFEQAGEILLGDDAPVAVNALMECLTNAFPQGDGANPPKRTKAGTGTTS